MATARARTTKPNETTDEMTEESTVAAASKPEYEGPAVPEVTGKGTFYEDFDNEEFPDAVQPDPGQLVVFRVESSNIVPIENKRTKVLEETEVVQIEILEGTTCTEKIKVGDEWEDTGELVPVGETRSLWINSFMLRKIWETWMPEPSEVGALKYKGKVEGRSNEYQKWFGKFDKVKPRQTLAR